VTDQLTSHERVTVDDVLARYGVSASTLTRRRKAGKLPSAARTGTKRRWTFLLSDVEALADAEHWRDQSSDQSVDQSNDAPPDQSPATTDLELGELRSTVEAQAETITRLTKERDRARSDLEQERTEKQREHTSRVIAETQATERATAIDQLTSDLEYERTERAAERERLAADLERERDQQQPAKSWLSRRLGRNR